MFTDLYKAFDPIHREKIEQIRLAHCLLKETVTAIMMLYTNMKAIVCSPDDDTDFFNIVAGVFKRRYISAVSVYNLPRLHT